MVDFFCGVAGGEKASCGTGKLNAELRCEPDVCENRHGDLFWDQYHPTEVVSEIQAFFLYGGPLVLVTPMNLAQYIGPG